MTPAEKDSAMQAFRAGRTQVLVATSVVEVGVDVPNATLMTIEGGERFGLAQLHQLRGRISRGSHPGYLCVFANAANDETQERLEAFTKTSDGFDLAELDFQLRGPGDLFGTKQHGLPPLRIADLARDVAVVEEARRDAQHLVAADPELASPATPGCGGWSSTATARRWIWAMWGRVRERVQGCPSFRGCPERDHNRLWLGEAETQSVVFRLTVTGRIVTIPSAARFVRRR